jgi:hypothetical protein
MPVVSLLLGLLALGSAPPALALAAPLSLHVDPTAGSDGFEGTQARPLASLRAAQVRKTLSWPRSCPRANFSRL